MALFTVFFDEVLVFLLLLCSGQHKPKSFLEIQQEQESDFSIKTTAPSVGGGGVTTPTGNKMKVSQLLKSILYKIIESKYLVRIRLPVACTSKYLSFQCYAYQIDKPNFKMH